MAHDNHTRNEMQAEVMREAREAREALPESVTLALGRARLHAGWYRSNGWAFPGWTSEIARGGDGLARFRVNTRAEVA